MKPQILFLSLIVLVMGCSSQALPNAGKVSFDDGEPVRSGSIEFRAISDGMRYSSRIGRGGEFQLTDADGEKGISPGDYEVIVLQIVLTEDLAMEQHQHGHTVPRRYADYYTSDLRCTVAENQTGPIEVVVAVE